MSEEVFGHTLQTSCIKGTRAIELCALAEAMLSNCLVKIEQLGVTVKAHPKKNMRNGGGFMTHAVVLSPDKLVYYHPEKG